MRTTLFLISSLFSFNYLISQVTMRASLPPSLDPGRSGSVEVVINKGSIQNFTKYQMDVPAGITISEVDSKGGNFTFENNRAKIIWVSAPQDPEFTIKMKITATNAAPSQANIDQRFYYLDNGVKKEVAADLVMLSIGVNNAVATIEPPNTSTTNNPTTSNTTAPVTETKTINTTVAKTEPKTEPKSEPKTEPKSEPKTEPKTEPKRLKLHRAPRQPLLLQMDLSIGFSWPPEVRIRERVNSQL